MREHLITMRPLLDLWKSARRQEKAIEETILEHSMKYQEVITWSTDGFFRETKEKGGLSQK